MKMFMIVFLQDFILSKVFKIQCLMLKDIYFKDFPNEKSKRLYLFI